MAWTISPRSGCASWRSTGRSAWCRRMPPCIALAAISARSGCPRKTMPHAPGVLLAAIAVRTTLIALFLILGFRLLGKRQLGQVNIYDLAMIMALANAIQNAMTEGKGHLAVGMVSAGTLILIGRGFTLLFIRVPRVEERIVGAPAVIVSGGKLMRDQMRREHVTEE